jgi:hypothetical protein
MQPGGISGGGVPSNLFPLLYNTLIRVDTNYEAPPYGLGPRMMMKKADFTISEVRSDGITQRRNRILISEPGLYELVFRSCKPEAKTSYRPSGIKQQIELSVVLTTGPTSLFGRRGWLHFRVR